MEVNIPKVIYKYRVADDRAINMLEMNQIYVAKPSDFNDPFDCLAQENMNKNFRDDIANNQHGLRLHSGLREQQQITDFITEELKKLGIMCFSSKPDSILMWSHYAGSHTGFCIGFNPKIILGNQSHLKKVIYKKTIDQHFLFNFFSKNRTEDEFNEELMKEYFLTKFIEWKYEREWRCICDQPGVVTNYPGEGVECIIFGLKMPQGNRNKIMNIFEKQEVKFYEAKKDDGKFSITIEEV